MLEQDSKWVESTKGLRTSILMNARDIQASYIISVEDGRTIIKRAEPNEQAEFTFEGPYDTWARIGRGELDLQSAVLKGSLRFKGSITKILFYKERFMRIAEIIKQIEKEY